MKKYICIYLILFAVLLLMFYTGGISQGIILNELDWGRLKAKTVFLIYNLIVSLVCLITAVISTASKKNSIRYKWIVPAAALILIVLFLPLVYVWQVGGFAGGPHEYFFYCNRILAKAIVAVLLQTLFRTVLPEYIRSLFGRKELK